MEYHSISWAVSQSRLVTIMWLSHHKDVLAPSWVCIACAFKEKEPQPSSVPSSATGLQQDTVPKRTELLLFPLAANPSGSVGMEVPMAKCPPEALGEKLGVLSALSHMESSPCFSCLGKVKQNQFCMCEQPFSNESKELSLFPLALPCSAHRRI